MRVQCMHSSGLAIALRGCMMQLRPVPAFAILLGFVTYGCAAPAPPEEKGSAESHLDGFEEPGAEDPSSPSDFETTSTSAPDTASSSDFGPTDTSMDEPPEESPSADPSETTTPSPADSSTNPSETPKTDPGTASPQCGFMQVRCEGARAFLCDQSGNWVNVGNVSGPGAACRQ